MQVRPIDEKEYSLRNCWPKGVYPCSVSKAEEGNSKKSGDPFFKMEVQIFHENGGFKTITSYVMAAGKAAWQLRAAAEAFGVLEQYKAGAIHAHDFEGKNAYAKVGIEEDENGQYDPKNIIREFTAKAPKQKTTEPQRTVVEELSDSIPF